MSSNGRDAGQAPTATAARRTSLRVRIAIAALALVGVGGLVVAALVGSGGDSGGSTISAAPAVDRVVPEPDSEVLQQQQVAVVLDVRYRLETLVVFPSEQPGNGVDVTSEVNHIEGLNRFEFAPGDGRLIEALAADTNCAVATYVLIARPEEADTVRWCFNVS